MLILHVADTLWRGLFKAAKMVRKHYPKFQLLDDAVKARDAKVHATWDREFNAWVGGDRSRKGGSPFQTKESKTRTYISMEFFLAADYV
jgi:hypothetical protein